MELKQNINRTWLVVEEILAKNVFAGSFFALHYFLTENSIEFYNYHIFKMLQTLKNNIQYCLKFLQKSFIYRHVEESLGLLLTFTNSVTSCKYMQIL
jgi:hypothetical protein